MAALISALPDRPLIVLDMAGASQAELSSDPIPRYTVVTSITASRGTTSGAHLITVSRSVTGTSAELLPA